MTEQRQGRGFRQRQKAQLFRVQRELQALLADWLSQSEKERDWQLYQWERRLQQQEDLELKWLHRGLVESINALEIHPQPLSIEEQARLGLLFEMYHALNRKRDPRRVRHSLQTRRETV